MYSTAVPYLIRHSVVHEYDGVGEQGTGRGSLLGSTRTRNPTGRWRTVRISAAFVNLLYRLHAIMREIALNPVFGQQHLQHLTIRYCIWAIQLN
jgi:hypothetical protein